MLLSVTIWLVFNMLMSMVVLGISGLVPMLLSMVIWLVSNMLMRMVVLGMKVFVLEQHPMVI